MDKVFPPNCLDFVLVTPMENGSAYAGSCPPRTPAGFKCCFVTPSHPLPPSFPPFSSRKCYRQFLGEDVGV